MVFRAAECKIARNLFDCNPPLVQVMVRCLKLNSLHHHLHHHLSYHLHLHNHHRRCLPVPTTSLSISSINHVQLPLSQETSMLLSSPLVNLFYVTVKLSWQYLLKVPYFQKNSIKVVIPTHVKTSICARYNVRIHSLFNRDIIRIFNGQGFDLSNL